MKDKVLDPMHMMFTTKKGECKGPNGQYELLSDQTGQPVVVSRLTGRKFRLSWQNIVEMAVENGIDDRVIHDETKSKHYHIQCESGRFFDGSSIPFGTKA